MALQSQTYVRHSIRPLNVFSFCGLPIDARRDDYHLSTKDLPPCQACERVRHQVTLMLGRKSRRLVEKSRNRADVSLAD